jgi:hypothetical protein
MVNIQADKSQSTQAVNWSAATEQEREKMGFMDKRQSNYSAQSTHKTGKQHAPKQSALALKSGCDVFWRVQDHGFDPASMLHEMNATADQQEHSAHAMNCMSAARKGQYRRRQQN